MQVVRLLGLPFSLLYSALLFTRNRLYDWGIFSSKHSAIKSIVVGNLSLGGTGKSPMVEYLIRTLHSQESIALVSRGYGRKTKGFVLGDSSSSPQDIGDEPAQILGKFPTIRAYISSNRHEAIDRAAKDKCTLAILDDAFQHRAIRGKFNILLTRFDNPWCNDFVIPSGSLRDHPREKRRADVVIVTNTPSETGEDEKEQLRKKLKVEAPIYFASTSYLPLRDILTNEQSDWPKNTIALSGIANPTSFLSEVKSRSTLLNHLKFPDHHSYGLSDVQRLRELIGSFADPNVVVVTTEKDAQKLKLLKAELEGISILALPIQLKLDDDINFQKHLQDSI